MRVHLLLIGLCLGTTCFLGGCASASPKEARAREQVRQIGRQLPPMPRQPAFRPDAPLDDYVRFAVIHHPAVRASYQEWKASVDAIAPNRALPDPKLTFEADIADTLMTFMPGLMFDFMTRGKRNAMAVEATAASVVAYRTYVSAVLKVASSVRKSWIELAYLETALDLKRQSVEALRQTSALAQAEYTTGQGMATLEQQVRLSDEEARAGSEIAMLKDKLTAARNVFRYSLGLLPEQAGSEWPHPHMAASEVPPEAELWRRIQSSNADLARMRDMVEMAVAGIEVAKSAGTPDFSLGAMADLKANPLMIRPTASLSLPAWRGRIAAAVSAAQARRDAAAARVSEEQLDMAAQLARMLAMIRESDRMISFIDRTALPNSEQTIATAAAAYQVGMASPAMAANARLMAIGMRLERAAALRDREIAVADLLLMSAETAPTGAPVLSSNNTAS